MTDESQRTASGRVEAALWNIRIDSATAEVVGAFSQAGIESLVLKGVALTDWYPADSARTYVDGDLLVPPADVDRAAHVLQRLGFAPKIDESGLPDWWQEHASSWKRIEDRGSIDLHRKLQGVRVDPAIAWGRVWSTSEEFELAGRPARRLGPPARAMYVTLHAAHDGEDGLKAQTHMDHALGEASADVWQAAATLAAELDALDAFAAGLDLTDAGRELAARLKLEPNRSVEAAIRAATAPPVALGFDQLATADGLDKARILLRKLFPPPGFVRHWWEPAQRGGLMLALGYAYRPIWLLLRTPAGYRAWRAARREVARQARDASNSR